MKPRDDQVAIMLANTGVTLVEFFRTYQAAGGTAVSLARELGLNPRTLWTKLSGRQNMTLKTLFRLCAAMGADVQLHLHRRGRLPRRLTPNTPAPTPPPTPPESLHRLIATAPLTTLRSRRGMRVSVGLQRCTLHAVAAIGEGWSGPQRIADAAGLDVRAARRALQALEAAGIITATHRPALGLPLGTPLYAYQIRRGRLVALAACTERTVA